MQIGDLERTTKGRYVLNTWMMPRLASMLKNGDTVLFVGTDTSWDYKTFFWNPSKQCDYKTLDIAERFNPDIVSNIEDCPVIPDASQSLVIMIGMYEFLDHPDKAYSEIYRMLVPGGYVMTAFPGKGYYPDNRGVSYEQIPGILANFQLIELYQIFEGREEPNSILTIAVKKA